MISRLALQQFHRRPRRKPLQFNDAFAAIPSDVAGDDDILKLK
jgi:hypothetical protein